MDTKQEPGPRREGGALSPNEIIIRPCEPAEVAPVADLLARQFATREPVTRYVAVSPQTMTEFVRPLLAASVPLGLTHVARHSGQLVGAILSLHGSEVPVAASLQQQLAPILDLLEQVAEPSRTHKQDAAHLFMLAVEPSASNRGVGERLMKTQIADFRRLGYQLCYGEATSAVSAKIFTRLGFEKVRERVAPVARHDDILLGLYVLELHPKG